MSNETEVTRDLVTLCQDKVFMDLAQSALDSGEATDIYSLVLQADEQSDFSPLNNPHSFLEGGYLYKVFYAKIKSQPELYQNLKVDSIFSVDKEELQMVVASCSQSKAYLIYSGTNAHEWHDNASLLSESDTPANQRALQYFDSQSSRYDSWVLAGHSKGGNKAFHVMVQRGQKGKIEGAYGYDSPGFSIDYIKANESAIGQTAERMYLLSNNLDYVHIFGIQIAGHQSWLNRGAYLGEDGQMFQTGWPLDNIINAMTTAVQHAPLLLYDFNNSHDYGLSNLVSHPDPMIAQFGELAAYLQAVLTPEDFEAFSQLVMHQLDAKDCAIGFKPEYDLPPGFYVRLGNALDEYFREQMALSESDSQLKSLMITSLFQEGNLFRKFPLALLLLGGGSWEVTYSYLGDEEKELVKQRMTLQPHRELHLEPGLYSDLNAHNQVKPPVRDYRLWCRETVMKVCQDLQSGEFSDLNQLADRLGIDWRQLRIQFYHQSYQSQLLMERRRTLEHYIQVVEQALEIDQHTAQCIQSDNNELAGLASQIRDLGNRICTGGKTYA